MGSELASQQLKELARPRATGWHLAASALYSVFAILPSTIAGLRGGTATGDIHGDRVALAHAYGRDVALYLAGAPRASKTLELCALVVLPAALFLLVSPRRGARLTLRDVQTAGLWAGGLVAFGHLTVLLAMLAGGGTVRIAWSWMWRLTVVTLISSIAELGLIALVLAWIHRRRALAFLVVLLASLIGTVFRIRQACVPVPPACIDASLLTMRAHDQVFATLAATMWLACAVVVLVRRRSRPNSA